MLHQFNLTEIKHCPYSLEQVTIGVLHYVAHYKGYTTLNMSILQKGIETY